MLYISAEIDDSECGEFEFALPVLVFHEAVQAC